MSKRELFGEWKPTLKLRIKTPNHGEIEFPIVEIPVLQQLHFREVTRETPTKIGLNEYRHKQHVRTEWLWIDVEHVDCFSDEYEEKKSGAV